MDDELRAWFEREGMLRYAAVGDEGGEVIEDARAPVVALGPRDEDFVLAPHPDRMRYPGKRLREMSMDDYNVFMYRWLEAAVAAGDVRCHHCGRQIIDADDLPDPETWDAILIEKEIVAWMVVHFDCKKPLPKKLKGLHPFELSPGEAPWYDLSQVIVPPSAPEMDDQTEHP